MSEGFLKSGKPVVVVGDGWSALGAVALFVPSGGEVVWVTGAGSRIMAPLPSLESNDGKNPALLAQLCRNLGIEIGPEQSGVYLREFKNKAFREPAWMRLEELSERRQERMETLWAPEQSLCNLFESRFDMSLAEIEEQMRARLTSESFANLRKLDGNPVQGFRVEAGKVTSVTLASGEEIACDAVIYADHWSGLAKLQGLPRSLSFTRHRNPHGVLQAIFTHRQPMAVGVLEGFFAPMNREAGEEFERRTWGYFSSDGKKSYWTLVLSSEEVEDNHEIAKKLRRMKSTLDKTFVGSTWLPSGDGSFFGTVTEEQVRFEETLIFAEGEVPSEKIEIDGMNGLVFLTDGYGPSGALQQLQLLFGTELCRTTSKRTASTYSQDAHLTNSALL